MVSSFLNKTNLGGENVERGRCVKNLAVNCLAGGIDVLSYDGFMAKLSVVLLKKELDITRSFLYKPFLFLLWASIAAVVLALIYTSSEVASVLAIGLSVILIVCTFVMLVLTLIHYLLDLKLIISVK